MYRIYNPNSVRWHKQIKPRQGVAGWRQDEVSPLGVGGTMRTRKQQLPKDFPFRLYEQDLDRRLGGMVKAKECLSSVLSCPGGKSPFLRHTAFRWIFHQGPSSKNPTEITWSADHFT